MAVFALERSGWCQLGLLKRRPPSLCKSLNVASHPEYSSVCAAMDGPVEWPPISALQKSGHGQSCRAWFSLYSGGWAC
jgi:hypothetical protein